MRVIQGIKLDDGLSAIDGGSRLIHSYFWLVTSALLQHWKASAVAVSVGHCSAGPFIPARD